MGIASYNIEYRNAGNLGTDGRSLGSTGSNKYWSRITLTTDSAGCSKFKISMTTACYNGATNSAYSAGAQAVISTSPDNSVYTGTAANLAASHPANNTIWLFDGTISYNMLPNTTYYIFVLPVWTTSNSFTTSTSNFTVTSEADFPVYKLSISAGNNSSVSISRTFSKYGSTGSLSNGANIFSGDVLEITFSGTTGYSASGTLNGTQITSGYRHTVSANVAVVITETVLSYSLSIVEAAGVTMTVIRTSSPAKKATIGTISNGETIYYNDVLKVNYSIDEAYNATVKLNGTSITNGFSHTVVGDVAIVASATIIVSETGFIFLDTGSAIEKFEIFVDTGSAIEKFERRIDNGTALEDY